MSALNTLREFLEEMPISMLYNHSHPDAILEWFSKTYLGKKEAIIILDKLEKVVISAEYIKYICGEGEYIAHGENKYSISTCSFKYRLMLNSANYCEYCRDKRRRFWEEHREIIERLPKNVRKFVMGLPLVKRPHSHYIALSDAKLVYRRSNHWSINNKFADIDRVLREFIIEYDKVAAKMTTNGPGFSAKCWRFSDVCVRLRRRA